MIGYNVYHSYDLPWFRTLSWWVKNAIKAINKMYIFSRFESFDFIKAEFYSDLYFAFPGPATPNQYAECNFK